MITYYINETWYHGCHQRRKDLIVLLYSWKQFYTSLDLQCHVLSMSQTISLIVPNNLEKLKSRLTLLSTHSFLN